MPRTSSACRSRGEKFAASSGMSCAARLSSLSMKDVSAPIFSAAAEKARRYWWTHSTSGRVKKLANLREVESIAALVLCVLRGEDEAVILNGFCERRPKSGGGRLIDLANRPVDELLQKILWNRHIRVARRGTGEPEATSYDLLFERAERNAVGLAWAHRRRPQTRIRTAPATWCQSSQNPRSQGQDRCVSPGQMKNTCET